VCVCVCVCVELAQEQHCYNDFQGKKRTIMEHYTNFLGIAGCSNHTASLSAIFISHVAHCPTKLCVALAC